MEQCEKCEGFKFDSATNRCDECGHQPSANSDTAKRVRPALMIEAFSKVAAALLPLNETEKRRVLSAASVFVGTPGEPND